MNRRYISLFALAVVMVGTSAALAGPNGAASTQSTGGRLDKFKAAMAQLDLSAAQKSHIEKIISDTKSNLKSIKTATNNASGGTAGNIHVRQMIQAAGKQIMSVLTEPQKTKLKQILKSERK